MDIYIYNGKRNVCDIRCVENHMYVCKTISVLYICVYKFGHLTVQLQYVCLGVYG